MMIYGYRIISWCERTGFIDMNEGSFFVYLSYDNIANILTFHIVLKCLNGANFIIIIITVTFYFKPFHPL